MKVNEIDHICIAVKGLEAARKTWGPILGECKPDTPSGDKPKRSGLRVLARRCRSRVD